MIDTHGMWLSLNSLMMLTTDNANFLVGWIHSYRDTDMAHVPHVYVGLTRAHSNYILMPD